MTTQWVLGIDVGSKKTGVAVGQSVTGLARPLGLIKIPASLLNDSNFSEIIRDWKINCIVIGLPVLADKKTHPLKKDINRLAEQLREKFSLPIYFADETLTSHEARSKFGQREEYDSAAAAIMIEDFFSNCNYRI